MSCPLCKSGKTYLFHESENREYHHCKTCDLVFVPKEFFVSKEQEKAKYDNHQNSIENKGYCNFLNRLLNPLESYLKRGDIGLDFGSGPGPTLSLLMEKRGYKMDIYDKFYHNKKEVFDKRYDFITSTEVIEHLKDPLFEIEKLWNILNKGGVFGIMTAFRVDDFKEWYYKRDLTHIRFFTPKTFEWIEKYLDAKILLCDNGVVIYKRAKKR